MKKKRPAGKGFVLVAVVTLIAGVGAAMFILAGIGNSILFESDTAYLRACERNLIASGLAWAQHNFEAQNRETFGKTTELDVAKMGIYEAGLSVTMSMATDRNSEAEISTRCSRSRRTFRHSGKYRIEL
ncbi:MAG: hypothetical protein ACYS76_09270 [Planctomycetota bacterium]|jgi:hypothetical protein